MDLNHIKLPASVIVDLYHSSLIETDNTMPMIEAETIIPEKQITNNGNDHNEFKWLGENRKNILIIASYTDAVHIPDDELNFLTGILGACKLNIGDVAVLNLKNHPEITYKELAKHFKSKIVFLFGIEPTALGLPISFPHFQVQSFANCSFLFSPVLKELESDKTLKSKLWVCLKRIFNL
jgi:hypothetical protein